jgi:hypothetical protein
MVEDHLKGWIVSRLSLAERVNIQRRDEEADTYRLAPGEAKGRCPCCRAYLKPVDAADPYLRCAACRKKRRLEPRGRGCP